MKSRKLSVLTHKLLLKEILLIIEVIVKQMQDLKIESAESKL